MPLIGLGTFGYNRYGLDVVADAVRTGIIVGYRLIDCESVYGNVAQIGLVLEEAMAEVRRDDFFVMSKVADELPDRKSPAVRHESDRPAPVCVTRDAPGPGYPGFRSPATP